MWRELAFKFPLVHEAVEDRDMLIRLEQYIPPTPHEIRCPCTGGVVVPAIPEHFPECDAIPALELKARQLAEVDAVKVQLELKPRCIDRNWTDKKTVDQLQDWWDPAVVTHCTRTFLDQLKSGI